MKKLFVLGIGLLSLNSCSVIPEEPSNKVKFNFDGSGILASETLSFEGVQEDWEKSEIDFNSVIKLNLKNVDERGYGLPDNITVNGAKDYYYQKEEKKLIVWVGEQDVSVQIQKVEEDTYLYRSEVFKFLEDNVNIYLEDIKYHIENLDPPLTVPEEEIAYGFESGEEYLYYARSKVTWNFKPDFNDTFSDDAKNTILNKINEDYVMFLDHSYLTSEISNSSPIDAFATYPFSSDYIWINEYFLGELNYFCLDENGCIDYGSGPELAPGSMQIYDCSIKGDKFYVTDNLNCADPNNFPPESIIKRRGYNFSGQLVSMDYIFIKNNFSSSSTAEYGSGWIHLDITFESTLQDIINNTTPRPVEG